MSSTAATTVTIFGAGAMGSAIASIVSAGGADVQHLRSADTDATIAGDLVVLAVPYHAQATIADQYGAQLAGKVVVDISNPLDFSTFDSLVVPVGSSAAAVLAERLPDSSVVKAFNTNFAATLASRSVGGQTTTVLVAGDDAAAKSAVIEIVVAGGVDAIDAGALSRAHELEAVGFLQLTLAVAEKVAWTGGFAVQR